MRVGRIVQDRLANARTFAVLFGEPKLGKTLAMARMFPRAWWFANVRGLQGMQDVGVFPIGVEDVFDLDELHKRTIALFGTPANPNRRAIEMCPAIVADDINLQAERTKRLLDDPTHPQHSKDGRARFGILGDKLRAYLDLVDGLGMSLGLTMHERIPTGDGGLGGPSLPSKGMSAELPKYVDFCYRMVAAPLRMPWPAEMWTNKRAAPNWVLGERRTVTPTGIAPPNLAEVVRACDVVVPRHEEIAAIADVWVERIAEAMKGETPTTIRGKKVMLHAINHLSKTPTRSGGTMPRWGIDWILQDALARAEIRQQNSISTLASSYGL